MMAADDEVESCRNALWSSVASILFLVAAIVRLTLPYLGPILDALALLLIPILSLTRKNKYEPDYHSPMTEADDCDDDSRYGLAWNEDEKTRPEAESNDR